MSKHAVRGLPRKGGERPDRCGDEPGDEDPLAPSDPDDAVEIPLDARMLASASVMTFVTRFAPFDVLFTPAGAPPYEELRAQVTRFGVSIRVADVEDVMAMKRATGREKDAAHLTTLVEFLMDRPATAQEGAEDDG